MNDTERDNLLQKMDSKIDEMRETDAKLVSVLFDANGHRGLCSQVETVCNKVEKNSISIRNIWITIAILGGGGGGTVGIVKLIEKFYGG